MDELQKVIVGLFRQEHEDWVMAIQKAEEGDGAVDINLGGKFAGRVESLLNAFREFESRVLKRRGKLK